MRTLVLIPCYNEEENIRSVVERLQATCPDVDYERLRIVRIKNTLRLDLIEVSESMIDEATGKGLSLEEGPYSLCFDENRNLITRKW